MPTFAGDTLQFPRLAAAVSTLSQLDEWSADDLMAWYTESELSSTYAQFDL